MKRKLSAILIVRNEANYIARSLGSLAWCDEIIVVDAFSTDDTAKIAKAASAAWGSKLKWFERAWDGFKNQRNFALDQASNEWVLCVDADEECSPELRAKIEAILAEENPHPYWKVRRQEYFLGKPIRYGVWNPSYQDRFFRKDGIRFVNEIHEYPKYPSEPKRIQEPLHHDPDFHPDKFLAKMNKYTTIEAQNRIVDGQRTNAFRMLLTGPAMFLKNYFYYKSYRDGMHGFVISLLEGVSRTVRHLKMWQIQAGLGKKVDRS